MYLKSFRRSFILIDNRNNQSFISIIDKCEFVKRLFKRVKINYKKRVEEINISFISNNIKIKYIENKYIYIYIFNVINK